MRPLLALLLVAACRSLPDPLWLASEQGIDVRLGDFEGFAGNGGFRIDRWWLSVTNRRSEPVAAIRIYARCIDPDTGAASSFIAVTSGLRPGESAECEAVPHPLDPAPIMMGKTAIDRIEVRPHR